MRLPLIFRAKAQNKIVSRVAGLSWALKDWWGLQELRWGWERKGVGRRTCWSRGHGGGKTWSGVLHNDQTTVTTELPLHWLT